MTGRTSTSLLSLLGHPALDYADTVLDERDPFLQVGLALLNGGQPLLHRLRLDGPLLQVGLGLAERRQAARCCPRGQRQQEEAADNKR